MRIRLLFTLAATLAAMSAASAQTHKDASGTVVPAFAGAGTTGRDYSGNQPALPNVGSNFTASGPFANYVLAATLPLNLARNFWGFQNDSGLNCALVFDDGTAASGTAPAKATVYPIAAGAGAGQQGGSDGDPYFKGRVQVYCAAALSGNAFVALYER